MIIPNDPPHPPHPRAKSSSPNRAEILPTHPSKPPAREILKTPLKPKNGKLQVLVKKIQKSKKNLKIL